jgi:rhamnosyltransferase subunit B
MGRIVLATIGSLGDLHPFIALGLELQQRGHSVVIASHCEYGDRVTPLGLEFQAMHPNNANLEDPAEMARVMDIQTGTKLVMTSLAAEVRESYRDLLAIAQGADLIIAGEVVFAAPLVGEILGIPWCRVALSPISFMSAHDLPLLPNVPWTYGTRNFGPIASGAITGLAKLISYPWMQPVHQLRQELGLPAAPLPMFDDKFSKVLTLALFSPTFAQPQPDWPSNTVQSGFVFYDGDATDRDATAQPELAAFLASGEPPIVFTLGSAAVMTPGRFFQESLIAAQKLGRRAVLLMGKNPAPIDRDPSCLVLNYASYSQLFPKACAIVHQGGIGTTAQGLRSGVPTVVMPYSHDQPDNAKRLERLGTSRTIPRDQYSADRAATELAELLNQPTYRSNAAAIGQKLSDESGLRGAGDAVDRLLQPSVTMA